MQGARKAIKEGKNLVVGNITKGNSFGVNCNLSEREREIMLSGGVLAQIKSQAKAN